MSNNARHSNPDADMSPRKRARRDEASHTSTTAASSVPSPSPLQPNSSSTTVAASSASTHATFTPPDPKPREDGDDTASLMSFRSVRPGEKRISKRGSWYGSLPRIAKSTASTHVATEPITAGTTTISRAPDFARFATRRPRPSTSLKTEQGSGGNAASEDKMVVDSSNTTQRPEPDNAKTSTALAAAVPLPQDMTEDEVPELPVLAKPAVHADSAADTSERPATSSGWLGWLGWSVEQEAKAKAVAQTTEVNVAPKADVLPANDAARLLNEASGNAGQPVSKPTTSLEAPSSTWFGLWPSSASTAKQPEPATEADVKAADSIKEEDVVMEDAPSTPTAHVSKPSAGSTWAFWSRDVPKSPEVEKQPPEAGEIAVMGESSEAHPERAKSDDVDTASKKTVAAKEPPLQAKENVETPSKKGKGGRTQSLYVASPARPSTPKAEATNVKAGSPAKTESKSSAKTSPPNILLPTFSSTYRLKQNPSILHQIAQVLLRTQQPPANHVFLRNDTPKIHKALAIGVHGIFPAAFLRTVMGQPTGTSIKFANHCADSIRGWADAHGSPDCEIEKIALEGEGKISERVENLWKLLLNWIDHIRTADLIVLACHSQGVPVGVMLVAKLIELGVVTNARIGICAMAGVSLGPFSHHKTGLGILTGSGAELYEFANSNSDISQRYVSALKVVLRYGVRVTYVGSIDDQLVPLESAINSPASHPYIYRAVFIDGRLHASDFIAHLVGFACKLRNLGITDHGLIRELSGPLAGSLYGGEGHSRLYDDPQVYDLGIAHTLETTDTVTPSECTIQAYRGPADANPYVLPWIMRGLLEEDFVKTELSSETAELLKQFDDWKPFTKALKDVKYRLEAVRSRL